MESHAVKRIAQANSVYCITYIMPQNYSLQNQPFETYAHEKQLEDEIVKEWVSCKASISGTVNMVKGLRILKMNVTK